MVEFDPVDFHPLARSRDHSLGASFRNLRSAKPCQFAGRDRSDVHHQKELRYGADPAAPRPFFWICAKSHWRGSQPQVLMVFTRIIALAEAAPGRELGVRPPGALTLLHHRCGARHCFLTAIEVLG
jgi:hypothetical protein